MKVSKKQLKRIIKEEKNRIMSEAARDIHLEDVEVGKSYELGYRQHRFVSQFHGWLCDKDGPRMMWEDDEAGNWEAYMFRGYMAVGSSADKLLIIKEEV